MNGGYDIILENITIKYCTEAVSLTDNATGQRAMGFTFEEALQKLVERNREYAQQPEVVEQREKERAVSLIDDMLIDEQLMAIIMVGLISSDTNKSKADIQHNLEQLKWISDGLNGYQTETPEKEERLHKLEQYVSDGIDILEHDRTKVPARLWMAEILGSELYDMIQIYNAYTSRTAVFDARDKYIQAKFGDCEEPVYDPMWGTWILGKKNEYGQICYKMGSAEKVFSDFLGCERVGRVNTYDSLGRRISSSGGCSDNLFWAAWQKVEDEDDVKELQDNGILSPYQKELWQKVCDYAKSRN